MSGPFETEREARTAALAAVHRDEPALLGNRRMLEEACSAARVPLGAYDSRVLGWLASWKPSTCMVIAGLVARAHDAGRARAGGAPVSGEDMEQFRGDVIRDSLMTDQLAEELLLQIVALEEIVAAAWPRRILVRARLRRDLRRSVAHIEGRTFTGRRIDALGTGWIERRP